MKPHVTLLVASFALVAASALVRAQDPPKAPADPVKQPEDPPKPGADFRKLLLDLDKEFNAIDNKARTDKAERLEKSLKQLQELQDTYTKAAKLDEAIAVREFLKQMKQNAANIVLGAKVLDDPGNLTAFRGKIGESYFFRVVGATTGRVYGTEVYADDSSLATAAVHAGLLKAGEPGIVKVTIVEGQPGYEGTTANEVTSAKFAQWYGSFILAAVKLEKK